MNNFSDGDKDKSIFWARISSHLPHSCFDLPSHSFPPNFASLVILRVRWNFLVFVFSLHSVHDVQEQSTKNDANVYS